jgi:hypothetical protein
MMVFQKAKHLVVGFKGRQRIQTSPSRKLRAKIKGLNAHENSLAKQCWGLETISSYKFQEAKVALGKGPILRFGG